MSSAAAAAAAVAGGGGDHHRMDAPPPGIFSSLEELVSVANAHAQAQGYKLVVVRSKTNAQGHKTWVHLACDRHGTKRNTHNLTDETRKKNRRSRRCECPMFCVANKNQSGLWELSVRNPEHNHGPYEPPQKKKKADVPPPHSSELVNLPLLRTPSACTADFCLVPIGTNNPSVSAEIAEVQRLLKRSGLSYSMSGGGTSIEGSWDDVMRIIGQAHSLLHGNGVVRVHTDIRIGSRTDKKQSVNDKVDAVRTLLNKDPHPQQVLPGNDNSHSDPMNDQHDNAAAQHAVNVNQQMNQAIAGINHSIAPNLDRIVPPGMGHHHHPQLQTMNGHPQHHHHPMMLPHNMHMH